MSLSDLLERGKHPGGLPVLDLNQCQFCAHFDGIEKAKTATGFTLKHHCAKKDCDNHADQRIVPLGNARSYKLPDNWDGQGA